jgi:PAS domain S-box-containing protein
LRTSSGLAVVTSDAAGRISYWNPAAQAMFGYAAQEAVGRHIELIVPARFQHDHARGLDRIRNGGAPALVGRAVEVIGLHADGHEFPIELSLSSWLGPQGREFGAHIQDISARHARESKLRHLAAHDPLTGLPNRREFCDRLDSALSENGHAT